MRYNRALHKLHILCFFALRQMVCRVKFEKVVFEESLWQRLPSSTEMEFLSNEAERRIR